MPKGQAVRVCTCLLLSPIHLAWLFLPGFLFSPAAVIFKNEMDFISMTLNEGLTTENLEVY